MEENFRRAMYLSRGDPMVFLERPISAILLAMSLALLVLLVLPEVKRSARRCSRSEHSRVPGKRSENRDPGYLCSQNRVPALRSLRSLGRDTRS